MGKNKTILMLTLLCTTLVVSGGGFSAPATHDIRNHNTNPLTTLGRTVFIRVNNIVMEDYIDFDPLHLQYVLDADFTWKVWVDHIYDDNYMKKGDGPKDDWNISPHWKESWDVGNKDEVQIRIEVWDRDKPYSDDDLCDINGEMSGKNKEARYVVFSYSLLKYNEKTFVFDGEDDGTAGLSKDDDDARILVTVSDDYDIEPALEVYPQNIVWTGQKGDTYRTTLTIENTGDPGSILVWSISPGIYMDDWGKWTFTPSEGEVKAGHQTQVTVKLKSKNSPLVGAMDYLDIKSNGGRIYVKVILTSSKTPENNRNQVSSKSLFLTRLLQKYSNVGLNDDVSFNTFFNLKNSKIGKIVGNKPVGVILKRTVT
ncbi:MAG: hypothetical protein DRN01_04375 [Thermoplasmata archaeon]|nr:MAG: hypothetical protein DRN01_04375 [Thermoplasmata archaeon]